LHTRELKTFSPHSARFNCVQQFWRGFVAHLGCTGNTASADVQHVGCVRLAYRLDLQICRGSVLVIAKLHIRQFRSNHRPLRLAQVATVQVIAKQQN
jgi:hypothetical protein